MGSRINKLAHILVDYSTAIQPGERVLVETSTAAEPLVRSIYRLILERGGQPHLLLSLPDQEEIFYSLANEDQLDFVPTFEKLAADEFDARIRIYAQTNSRALGGLDPARQARRQKATAKVQQVIMRRGAEGSMRWVSTQYPTPAYAMDAEMGSAAYTDYFYKACHADEATPDPVAYWKSVRSEQRQHIALIEGHDLVHLLGPDVDLSLSVKGRRFNNSCGLHNLPDGEIYTGPVETSLNGWVRYTYPAIFGGRVVEGVELTFEKGRVVKANARKEQAFLLSMLESDAGARYVGEFAIGTNFQINRFTRNILFDEKIGGTFHLALGMGYPETGSLNESVIHWDMICDLRTDSEIRVDGELFYKNGEFILK
jgi:aminopeptidase